MPDAARRIPPLEEFEGLWVLERRIDDRRERSKGRFRGEARFTPSPEGGYDYYESGTLRYGDSQGLNAERRFLWRESGAGIAVFFEDGRPFHEIEADKSMPEALHMCAPDLYNVAYDFTRWPQWQAIWNVLGPKKDYRMTSQYRRN